MLATAKFSLIVGGEPTVRLAAAEVPVPPFVDDAAPVVLVSNPAAVPVTLSDTRQLPPTATAPPFRLTALAPWAAVTVPPQLFVNPFGVEMISPAGNVSANATPASATVLAAGFVTVKLNDVVPFTGMLAAPKDSPSDGGATTIRLAVAVLPVPAFDEVTAVLVFVKLPALLPVKLTESVQLLPAAIVPPLRVREPVAASAVAVPPQLFVSPLGVEIASPAGSVSLNPTPVSDTVFAAGLVIVKASEVVPFTAILGAPNDSAIVGAAGELGVGLGLGVGSGVGVGPGPALPPPPPHAVRLAAKQHASIIPQMLFPTLRRPSNFIRLHNFLLPEAYLATVGTKLASCVTQQPNWN
jgi:hypothetical protein